MWQDFRYGLRSIRNQPAFTTLAVLTLALGIGAATTIFSVIQNVLLDPFPYKDADRVVAIRIHDATDPECPVDLVANTPREVPVPCAVSTSLAFGGNDSALVLRAV